MKNVWFLFAFLASFLICQLFGTFFMSIACINYFLILGGFLIRKISRKWHVALMSLGILSDLVLVLTLEVKRDAIETALKFDLSLLNQGHIFSSLLATLLYFPMIFTGIMILRQSKYRKYHQKIGYLVIAFRTLGFALMFSMIKNF